MILVHRLTTSILKTTWNAMEAPNFPESQKIQSAHCPGIVMASVLYSGMQNMSSVLHPITQMHKPVVTTA